MPCHCSYHPPGNPRGCRGALSIYAPYVKTPAITFEYEVPSAEEFRKRDCTHWHYPLSCSRTEINSSAPGIKDEGNCSACTEIAGYAYAGPTAPRPGSLCLVCGNFHLCKRIRKKIRNRQGALRFSGKSACRPEYDQPECLHRASPVVDDEYLNHNSIQFHQHLGYSMVGEFHKCAYKFGRWYNMVWMEKIIADHLTDSPM